MREVLESVGLYVRLHIAARVGTYSFGKNMCGTCAICSFALVKVLAKLGHPSEFIVGTYGGIGHCWVECKGFFVDITATQFSHRVFDYVTKDFPEAYVTQAGVGEGLGEDIQYHVELRGSKALDHVKDWGNHGPKAHKAMIEEAVAAVTWTFIRE